MNAERRFFLAALAQFATPRALAQGFAGLGAAAGGYAEVTPGKPLLFPQDLGAHPEFRTEWWYLTANLTDAAGAAYGVQWTLFRQATEPGPQRGGWANQQTFMGHAAATSADAHLFTETFARGGVGQAGVAAEPFCAFIDDWRFEAAGDAPGMTQMRVSAKGPEFSYRLDLSAGGPLVLHGDKGFSRKSEEGQASYYFSQPFFTAEGVLSLRGAERKVTGQAWMDHEWSSRGLAASQKGWDWFSLHLEGGAKLMLFRMRGDAGPPFYAGTHIGADGAARALAGADFSLTPVGETMVAGRRIPTRWRVRVNSLSLDIETTPLNPQSWMAARFAYWEGPIAFRGTQTGRGYLEMTGY